MVTVSGVGLITLMHTPWPPAGLNIAQATKTLCFRGILSTTQVSLTGCLALPLICILGMRGTCTISTSATGTGAEGLRRILWSLVISVSLSCLAPTDSTQDAVLMQCWWRMQHWPSRMSSPRMTLAENWSTMTWAAEIVLSTRTYLLMLSLKLRVVCPWLWPAVDRCRVSVADT